MEHRVEILLRTMQSHIHSCKENRTRRGEDKEGQSGALGLGMPGMSLLQILERINREEELGD